MTHYVAKFSTGFILERKNSKRAYTHAWCVRASDGGIKECGLAASSELAHRAASSAARWFEKDRGGTFPVEIIPVEIRSAP